MCVCVCVFRCRYLCLCLTLTLTLALAVQGKIEVRNRVAQVIQVAAAGKEFKLLVSENELVAQKFKVKVTANSMDELEEAIAAKASVRRISASPSHFSTQK